MIVLAKSLKFKSLQEFVEYKVNYTLRDKDENHKKYFWLLKVLNIVIPENNYLCHDCRGRGWSSVQVGYYDSKQETCPICRGTGYLNESIYKSLWKIFKEKEKNIQEEFLKKKKTFESIKKRLSNKQFKFILEHGEWFRK